MADAYAKSPSTQIGSPPPSVSSQPDHRTRWSRLSNQLDHKDFSSVIDLYKEEEIPDELRDLCQEWFESKDWISESRKEEGEVGITGQVFLNQLEEEVTQKKKRESNRYKRAKYASLIGHLKEKFHENGCEFVKKVAKCMKYEKELLGEEDTSVEMMENHLTKRLHSEWVQKCAQVSNKAKENAHMLEVIRQGVKILQSDQEKFCSMLTSNNRQSLTACKKEKLMQGIENLQHAHTQLAGAFGRLISNGIREMCNELFLLDSTWRTKQKEELVSGLPPPPLKHLRELYSLTADQIVAARDLLVEHKQLLDHEEIKSTTERFIQTLALIDTHTSALGDQFQRLIRWSFLFDQLPRTQSKSTPAGNIRAANAKFECSVRSLLPVGLYGRSNLPTVSLYLIKEEHLSHESIIRSQSKEPAPPDRLIYASVNNGTATMKPECNNQARAHLRNLKLPKFRRSTDDSRDAREQRYGLLARCKVTMNPEPIYCDTIAYPVVVTVQSSQDADALACLFWHSAFCPTYIVQRELFSPSQHWKKSVKWAHMSEALHYYLEKETDRGLFPNDRKYLYRKFLRNIDEEDEVDNGEEINWVCFNKDKMEIDGTTMKFTPWKWYLGVVSLIKRNFKEEWKKRSVVGFISKEEAKVLFGKKCPSRTGLIRFSETRQVTGQASEICGKASLMYAAKSEQNDKWYRDQTMIGADGINDLPRYLKNVEIRLKTGEAMPLEYMICVGREGKYKVKTLDSAFPYIGGSDFSSEYPDGIRAQILKPREADLVAESPAMVAPDSVQSSHTDESCFSTVHDFLSTQQSTVVSEAVGSLGQLVASSSAPKGENSDSSVELNIDLEEISRSSLSQDFQGVDEVMLPGAMDSTTFASLIQNDPSLPAPTLTTANQEGILLDPNVQAMVSQEQVTTESHHFFEDFANATADHFPGFNQVSGSTSDFTSMSLAFPTSVTTTTVTSSVETSMEHLALETENVYSENNL